MADEPFSPNGEPQRPALPWVLFAISTIVAVLASAGFVYLITKRTTGPVEVLRDFYAARAERDCDASFEILADEVQQEYTEDAWCQSLQATDREFPETFDVQEVILEGEVATVTVLDTTGTIAWELERDERSWRLIGETEPGGGVGPETPAS